MVYGVVRSTLRVVTPVVKHNEVKKVGIWCFSHTVKLVRLRGDEI